MQRSANPMRVALAGGYGAEVEIADDGAAAFARAEALAREEGRTLIHPFEGRAVALGTATVGLELARQVPELDAVLVAIGGGGLAAGLGAALDQLQPNARVYGVEPVGADVMHRSFAAGAPARIERIDTIADSLAPPLTLPYTFALCRRHVDELVLVDDESMRRSMALLYREAKLVTEPAAAATTAALLGPLRERLRGQRIALVVCGANIDLDSYSALVRPYL
jgi:threonine dehydratase